MPEVAYDGEHDGAAPEVGRKYRVERFLAFPFTGVVMGVDGSWIDLEITAGEHYAKGESVRVRRDEATFVLTMTSDEWCSPPEIATPLYRFWGAADVDPCSNSRSIIQAHERYEWGGLLRSWGESTYANWPYSKNEPWSAKAIYEMRIKTVRELVVLCMFAASTQWWRNLMIEPRRNPRVIATKRLKFLGPNGESVDSSRFEPALIYYGSRHAAFDREFKSITMWSTWGR